jgi:hypothetical protein
MTAVVAAWRFTLGALVVVSAVREVNVQRQRAFEERITTDLRMRLQDIEERRRYAQRIALEKPEQLRRLFAMSREELEATASGDECHHRRHDNRRTDWGRGRVR